MNKCKCEKGEHHKNMTNDERINHLESCVAEIIHRLSCVKGELADLNKQQL